jgi:hypothetical protein
MRKSRVLLAGVAVAAAGIATSAFTASNTVDRSIAGYGSAEVAGVEALNIEYVQNADASLLDSVVFKVNEDVMDTLSTLTLYKVATDPDDPDVVVPSSAACLPTTVLTDYFVTCSFGATPIAFQAFDKLGLTVVSQ